MCKMLSLVIDLVMSYGVVTIVYVEYIVCIDMEKSIKPMSNVRPYCRRCRWRMVQDRFEVRIPKRRKKACIGGISNCRRVSRLDMIRLVPLIHRLVQ